jgi:hypothetical protein
MVNRTLVTAWCEAGGHEYEREVKGGRPPLSCPKHRSRPKRPPEVGAKISQSKKGVRQTDLAPGELTRTEAWREFGIGRAVLLDGVESGKLRHRRVERPGKQRDTIVFDREQLREDLARCPCSHPDCDPPAPAPGLSGRCGKHAARGEPAVELECQYQYCEKKRFVRCVSWLAEGEGRGHYCSNECKGKAFAASRPPGYLRKIAAVGGDKARDHYDAVNKAITAAGRLTTTQFAGRLATSASVIRADAKQGLAPGELAVFHEDRLLRGEDATRAVGTVRLVFRGDEAAISHYRGRVLANPHRERCLKPDFMVKQQRRTMHLHEGKGLSEDQAKAAVEAAVHARRKEIRRRGPKPAVSVSPINVERNAALDQARLELDAEHRGGLRPKPPSARAVRLRAAENIAANKPHLLPADYVQGGQLRAHYGDVAIALLAKAEKACKSA